MPQPFKTRTRSLRLAKVSAMSSDDLFLESVPFSELTLGREARLTRTLTKEDIELFATVTGDVNPAHLDETYANATIFHGIIGHGMWTGSLISALLGTILPGPGTIYLDQSFTFKKPVHIGEEITAIIRVKEKHPEKPIVVFDCLVYNPKHEVVLEGIARVLAPTQKMRLSRNKLPTVEIQDRDKYQQFLESCRQYTPLKMAVVHPMQPHFLETIVAAVEEKLIDPVLVGSKTRLLQVAKETGIDLSKWPIMDALHSHGAAEIAVAMAAKGEVHGIMKGSLHTHELLSAIVKSDSGLRTDRRMSHAYLIDVHTYPKPFVLTDAAINIAPSLEEKADICQNAIDLWKALFGQSQTPKVAILAAVETVNAKMKATLDAAALCKMADRGQIVGGLLDGPLAFDNAVSKAAAAEKGITSLVAGDADIFLAPNIEAANMLAKQLTFLAHADAAGLVLGARVPIVLTSRADSLRTRVISCGLAMRLHHGKAS